MTPNLPRLVSATLLCIIGVGGCAFVGPPDPDDFRFLSVAVVYSNDRTDDTWPKYGPMPNQKLLKITFTTRSDLLRAALEGGYHIDNRIDFCRRDTDVYSAGVNFIPWVFWNGIDLSRPDLYEAEGASIREVFDSTPLHTFYVYMDVAIEFSQPFGIVHGEPPPLLYNLEEKPDDVCLTVHGFAFIRRHFTSNTVFVPEQAIANALATGR